MKNEAYIGDIVTNKALIVWDGTQKKEIKNENHVDQYYIRYHHEALVSNEVFERVNTLLDAKKLAGQRNFKGIGSRYYYSCS